MGFFRFNFSDLPDKGLDYLHTHEPCVIHTDLNCGKLMVNQWQCWPVGKNPSARSILGTPEFVAPELYGENYIEMIYKVTSGVRPQAMNKVKDPEVRAFIDKCLAQPRARPSAAELLWDPFFDVIFDEEGDDDDNANRLQR